MSSLKTSLFGKATAVVVAFILAITVLGSITLLAPPLHAVGPAATYFFQTVPLGSDPCQNPSIAKSSASIAITTATTTELVAAVAGQKVYVCRLYSSIVGTSPTIQFETGTKVSTACDTGAAALSGAFVIPTTTVIAWGGADTLVTSASGGELCLVTAGTGSPTFEGFATYVQM